MDITTREMLEYYRGFDPIEFKYRLFEKKMDEQEKWNCYARIAEYEASSQFTNLTKKNYGDNYANLNLVYDQEEANKDRMELLDLIFNKIISQYINIDGIERLFSETYIEFEWEMHLSADYKKHNMNFYRDHFIHQIRDAYMMDKFMEEFGFYEKIKRILENEGESKVSRYVHGCLVQQEYRDGSQYRELVEKAEGVEVVGNDEPSETLRDFYLRNMIYMASYMAALFHDIGYPEAYYMTTSRHIIDYIADLYTLNPGMNDIRRVYSLLQNSLLFRVVPLNEIERRLNNIKKPEHGTLSAIVFLLHFYENGAIYKLPPYKSAAVELAAMAIYNHTNTYGIQGKKNADYYRPCFNLNPISYLLRICDDLQEWDRIYFVISNKSNILFCNKCKTPIVRKKYTAGKEMYERAIYECNCRNNQMSCFSQAFDGQARFPYRRIYNVSVCEKLHIEELDNKRKLLIQLDYNRYKLLHIAYENPTYAKYRTDELNHLKYLFEAQRDIPRIYLDYFVTSNPVHIKAEMVWEYLLKEDENKEILTQFYKNKEKTNEELNSIVEKMLEYCSPLFDIFSPNKDSCRECGFCSNLINALLCLDSGSKKGGYSSYKNEEHVSCLSHLVQVGGNLAEYPELQKIFKKYEETEAEIFYETVPKKMGDNVHELVKRCPIVRMREYMKKAFRLYIRLSICQELSMENNGKTVEGTAEFVRKQGADLSEAYKFWPELQCLIEDCFLQFTRMYSNISSKAFYPEGYYKQFENGERKKALFPKTFKNRESEEYYYTALVRYTDPERYEPVLNRKEDSYVDAFTDLYLFWKIDTSFQVFRKKDSSQRC